MSITAEITYRRVYSDCSGAPALVEVSEFLGEDAPKLLFALDFLGEVKCHLVGVRNDEGYPYAARARHIRAARAAYEYEIVACLSREWLARNAEMYAVVGKEG